jgi:hypothetical protein
VATYQFSALADGQAISFSPDADHELRHCSDLTVI